MAGARSITAPLFLVVCTLHYYHVTSMNSFTLGRYFLFQVAGMNHQLGRCIARAFSISLAGVTVTLTTAQTTQHSIDRMGKAAQNHPAVFCISHVLLTCATAGQCGTFVFRSRDGDFALDVLGLHDFSNGDSLRVIPVSGYGTQYYLMSLGQRAFLIILSPSNDNNINMKLKSNTSVALPGRFRSYAGDHFSITLEREQSYSMFDCKVNQADLTGTMLRSVSPFGVITGNCLTSVPSSTACSTGEAQENFIADMVLPLETYGRHFVVIETEVQASTSRYAVVVTSEANTTVQVVETVVHHKVVILEAGASYSLYSFPSQHYFVLTDKPCSCYLVIPSTCNETDFGDGSVTVVVPHELFFNLYMWSFQIDGHGEELQTYVLLVSHTWYSNRIQLNGTSLRDKYKVEWNKVIGTTDWVVGSVHMQGGGSHFAALTSSLHRFGCYILVSKEGFGFVSNAGFILSNLNVDLKPCMHTIKTDYFDYIDNDCDGKIDEEIKNNIDDDGDGKSDEDVGMPDLVAGQWTEWEEWTCRDECGNSTYVKYRQCKTPHEGVLDIQCPGMSEGTKKGVCRSHKYCQAECPQGTFGVKCTEDCSHCESKCHQLNGSCRSCKPGWTGPQFACMQECPKWTYGDKCRHLCELKCGEDCTERVQGHCPGSQVMFSIMLPFVFSPMLACSIFFAACSLLKYKEEKHQNKKYTDTNSSSSISIATEL